MCIDVVLYETEKSMINTCRYRVVIVVYCRFVIVVYCRVVVVIIVVVL